MTNLRTTNVDKNDILLVCFTMVVNLAVLWNVTPCSLTHRFSLRFSYYAKCAASQPRMLPS
jgi:hypothetical protein